MAIRTAPLNLLAFPQAWRASSRRLSLRYLCFPRIDPDVPLGPGLPAFADASLAFELNVISSLASLPRTADVGQVLGGAMAGTPLAVPSGPVDRADAFETLRTLLDIQPRSPGIPAGPKAVRRILKPLTASWRSLAGDRHQGRFLVDEDAVACAIHESLADQPSLPQQPPAVLRWGEAMALALRTEPLAKALGLIGEVSVQLPPDLLSDGGWLFFGLHSTSDYSAVPALVNLQAARVPPLGSDRALYAAALFPVDQGDFIPDDPIAEAASYANGFGKMVHASQEVDAAADPAPGTGDGDCIRLAWDDEQVTEWLNRQSDPDAGTPMGTMGYRVDVRDLTVSSDWQSLQQVESIGPVMLGGLDLGAWQGERCVEVVPLRRKKPPASEFWLPDYFTTWRGSSLVLSDNDFVRLQNAASQPGPEYAALKAHLQDREKTFAPVSHDAVRLRYGHRYAFRVRLADLALGGPDASVETPEDPDGQGGHTAEVQFMRRRRPGAVEILKLPTRDEPWLVLERPKLRFPELRFAGDALLDSEADQILAGKPDPDVSRLTVSLEVKALAGERLEWQPLYSVSRSFPPGQLTLPLSMVDVGCLADLVLPGPIDALPIPADRELRLTLTAMGRTDEGYFADEQSRTGVPTAIPLKAAARSEGELIAGAAQPLTSYFLRAPSPDENAPRPVDLMAGDLDLANDGLMLAGAGGQRTVFACGAGLRHTPSPDRHSIAFSSDADLRQRWINILAFDVLRDWSWRGLAEKGLVVERSVSRAGDPPAWRPVGTVELPLTVARTALPPTDGARDEERQSTRVLFIDAISPLEVYGRDHPYELEVAYRVMPQFPADVPNSGQPMMLSTRLPVVTPPRQVPKLVSAGIALSPFLPVRDYSMTNERERHLWFEFEAEPADPGDAYFARIVALAPDPLLTGIDEAVPVAFEPPLPVDPEWLRSVVPGQSADTAGLSAMPVRLGGGQDGRHVLVTLPEGLNAEAPELTGMFTYEIRIGHADERWCTAHGRWGPAFRISGVQHPPPPLRCEAARTSDRILVTAPFAAPVHQGRNVEPRPAATRLWALLYARLAQADGSSFRNLLLLRSEIEHPREAGRIGTSAQASSQGCATFRLQKIYDELEARGLPANVPLTALAAEFYTDPPVHDPVGAELGEARLMRASALVPVPDEC